MMPYATLPEGFPEPPPIPPHYREDQRWTGAHLTELTQKYPDQWIAVFNKEVVAFGTDLGEVERVALARSGGKEVYTLLVESSPRWYSNCAVLPRND